MVEGRSQESFHHGEHNQDEFFRICENGVCIKASEVETKLDECNIHEAESSLREGLSLNFEEARALLGRLEYQRGNIEGALRVFDGIDLQAAVNRLQPSSFCSSSSNRARGSSDSQCSVPQHSANLVLEAVLLKAKSLQKLGRFKDAAYECKSVLDAVGKIFQQGIPKAEVDNRLRETVSQAVELLPELWKQAGNYNEAMSSYRRALLSQWNLENDCCSRIQKAFAVFLLHTGLEASPPSFGDQMDTSYVPKNNLEEAILLLMILLQKCNSGKIKWDPTILEHLTYALSLCSQTSALGKQLEELLPGVMQRVDRWNALALCYSGAGQYKDALNLLRKSLHKHEPPNDIAALLLAAKICSKDHHLAGEGIGYARVAVSEAEISNMHLKGMALRLLGICLGKQAKVSSSDFERSSLQSEAVKSLENAVSYERDNPDLDFELGLEYAEQRNVSAAMHHAKKYIYSTGGSLSRGWRLLALVFTGQKKFSQAEAVIDVALDETVKWEQAPLLKLKAKLQILLSRPTDAIQTYSNLLALVQAQWKVYGPFRSTSQVEDTKLTEFEVWHDIATLYSTLSHWKDADMCLAKARDLNQYSADILLIQGAMYQERGQVQAALSAYINSVFIDPYYLPCKIQIGGLLSSMSSSSLPIAKAYLSDALRMEPTSAKAWYYLGKVHKAAGRIADAVECLQAAAMLDEFEPAESFGSIM